MERWLLVVANEETNFDAAQKDWLKKGVSLTIIPTMEAAISNLPQQDYLAIVVFSDNPSFASKIPEARRINPGIPVICMPSDNYINQDEIINNVESAGCMVNLGSRQTDFNTGSLPQGMEQCEKLSFKELVMYPQYRRVIFMEQDVKLSNYQFKAMEMLLSNRGRVLTFYQIYDHIYGEDTEPESINAAIRHIVTQIRKRMNAVGPFDYIENVRGAGYRIGCKV